MKSNEELKQMAGQVFLPLALMSSEDLKNFFDKKPALIYEYMHEAGPRSINGYPIFMSLKYLIEEELDIMNKYVDALRKAQEGVAI